MPENFEICLLDSVSQDALRTALSKHLPAPIEDVVPFVDWLELPPERLLARPA